MRLTLPWGWMIMPKYRTDTRACSCPGFWFRRTCKHYRAYGEAMALVVEQDKANKAMASQEARLAPWGKGSKAATVAAFLPKRHPVPLSSQGLPGNSW